jgi:hypothetical protein
MSISPQAAAMLAQEARALLTRLERVKPFALVEPMLPAASLLPAARSATERHLAAGRRAMLHQLQSYLAWVGGAQARGDTAPQAQRRLAFLRLRFNAMLTQFDLFNDVVSQRSEHDTGVWLRGLDVLATDALTLPGAPYEVPPLMCYLDRGIGAAIRRARTRLPGGGESPVAIIRVPRERMVGSGIGASLVHEVGHQGNALLGLTASLRAAMRAHPLAGGTAWRLFERWIDEIASDFWACARLGISATTGLMTVVSLPRAFVFRLNANDPHPVPWIRVLLSCTLGQVLHPHPQWARLRGVWEECYPPDGLPPARRALLDALAEALPAFAAWLAGHRVAAAGHLPLGELLNVARRQPARLVALFDHWRGQPAGMYRAAPSLVFAALGQARFDGRLSPEDEGLLVARLLTHWALRSDLEEAAPAPAPFPVPLPAPAVKARLALA